MHFYICVTLRKVFAPHGQHKESIYCLFDKNRLPRRKLFIPTSYVYRNDIKTTENLKIKLMYSCDFSIKYIFYETLYIYL